jgi:hypothetical protein
MVSSNNVRLWRRNAGAVQNRDAEGCVLEGDVEQWGELDCRLEATPCVVCSCCSIVITLPKANSVVVVRFLSLLPRCD